MHFKIFDIFPDVPSELKKWLFLKIIIGLLMEQYEYTINKQFT